MPLIFYYNEVGTEVLVIDDLLIYCRPQLFYPQPNYQTNTSLIFYFRFRHQWITGSRPVQ